MGDFFSPWGAFFGACPTLYKNLCGRLCSGNVVVVVAVVVVKISNENNNNNIKPNNNKYGNNNNNHNNSNSNRKTRKIYINSTVFKGNILSF